MFGHNKKKAAAEMMAPQWLKIMIESRDIVNRTTDPEVFFSRYDTVKEMAEKLASISRYVKLKGTKPAEVLRMAREQEEAATRDLVLRCFARAHLNAEKVKTKKRESGASSRSSRAPWSRTSSGCQKRTRSWCRCSTIRRLQS